MKTTKKKSGHQVSVTGTKAVRAGDWEKRKAAACKSADESARQGHDYWSPEKARPTKSEVAKTLTQASVIGMLFGLPPYSPSKTKKESIFGKLPREKFADGLVDGFKAKSKRKYHRGHRGRFARLISKLAEVDELKGFPAGDSENPRRSIMERAIEVRSSRNKTYGGPAREWECQAGMLTAYLLRRFGAGAPVIAPHDIGIFNMIQKISRHASSIQSDGYHADNMIDLAGFADCVDEVINSYQPQRVD